MSLKGYAKWEKPQKKEHVDPSSQNRRLRNFGEIGSVSWHHGSRVIRDQRQEQRSVAFGMCPLGTETPAVLFFDLASVPIDERVL